ncbi:MAG: DUF4097 family beta strand repeat-containing protein [Candidatus Bipolaricaulota bacterium]|nr:DUF4097 family beta strand repeat-containing protein [Candidatus Bipolaricaulota bacterium]
MRGKNWMRLSVAVVASAALFGLAACDLEGIVGGRFEGTRTETAAFPTSGIPMLEVESSNGAVTVRGVPGQTDVRVTATLRSRGGSQSEANDHVGALTIHMEQQGGRVMLAYRAIEQTSDLRRYSGVAFDVTTPGMADVNAQTSNGAVSVSALQGRFDLRTSNGVIDTADVVGELTANTSNGRISVERCQGVLDLTTSNGEISMVDVSAAFAATTSNGRIGFSGTIIGDTNSLVTSNGRIEVAVAATASVEFRATTTSGSISSTLPLVGDTQGKEWLAALNPPTRAKVSLEASNGGIDITARP